MAGEKMKKIQYPGLEALKGIADGMREEYLRKTDTASYSIIRLETPQEGYAESYQMTKDGKTVGVPINIPKDKFLKSADVKVCVEDNVPEEGCKAGDKYIELVVETTDGSGDGGHLFLMLKDLMDPVRAGHGIDISDENEISIKLDAENANGLSVGEAGLSMGLATAEAAGAMSAADKKKLDGLEFVEITREEAKALIISGGTDSGGQQEA